MNFKVACIMDVGHFQFNLSITCGKSLFLYLQMKNNINSTGPCLPSNNIDESIENRGVMRNFRPLFLYVHDVQT